MLRQLAPLFPATLRIDTVLSGHSFARVLFSFASWNNDSNGNKSSSKQELCVLLCIVAGRIFR